MSEEFISYIWLFRLYTGIPKLFTGESFLVETPGEPNRDAGPDFLGARIRIGKTLWIGNVEVHIRSSDWDKHGHQHDKAYETVILHVVFEHDREVMLSDNTHLPVYEMKNCIDSSLYARYLQFMASPAEIPCKYLLRPNHLPMPEQWLISLGTQRLIRKSEASGYLQQRLGTDWHELFYVSFCRSFGNKVNDDVFEMLALKTPLRLVRHCLNDITRLEALFFGQAGLLPDVVSPEDDPYPVELHGHYTDFIYTYHCEPLDACHWKFLRTRPANFPTIRIAQLAALISGFLAINPMSMDSIMAWMSEAVKIKVSPYWRKHYHFDRQGGKLPDSIGRQSVERLFINGIVPPLLQYASTYEKHELISSIIDVMGTLAPENNHIIRQWKSLGVRSDSSLVTQGLMELFNEYCRLKKCLECRFGHQLLAGSA